MSAPMTCHLLWIPLRHLHRLPSSTAGFRSTFDTVCRLPYGCLLFLYRLDLTFTSLITLIAIMNCLFPP